MPFLRIFDWLTRIVPGALLVSRKPTNSTVTFFLLTHAQQRSYLLVMSWQNIPDDSTSFLQELNSPTLSTYVHGPRLPLSDSRSQTQDTSGLEMFLPPPGVSRGIDLDIQPAFSGRDPTLNLGSGSTFNFTSPPYGSNSIGNFDFNFAFDTNLL